MAKEKKAATKAIEIDSKVQLKIGRGTKEGIVKDISEGVATVEYGDKRCTRNISKLIAL
jgi:hypothetical protein